MGKIRNRHPHWVLVARKPLRVVRSISVATDITRGKRFPAKMESHHEGYFPDNGAHILKPSVFLSGRAPCLLSEHATGDKN